MPHFPRRRRWPLGWLPDPCACSAPRFDRCTDAVCDAQAGHLAPRGGAYDSSWPTLNRIADGLAHEQAPARNDRRWWSA